jgi:hypothetical protein
MWDSWSLAEKIGYFWLIIHQSECQLSGLITKLLPKCVKICVKRTKTNLLLLSDE